VKIPFLLLLSHFGRDLHSNLYLVVLGDYYSKFESDSNSLMTKPFSLVQLRDDMHTGCCSAAGRSFGTPLSFYTRLLVNALAGIWVRFLTPLGLQAQGPGIVHGQRRVDVLTHFSGRLDNIARVLSEYCNMGMQALLDATFEVWVLKDIGRKKVFEVG
jgi:hypothetical protein